MDDNWRIEVQQNQPRRLVARAGAGHTEDVILRARRLA